jgi:hypothetical protein
METKLLIGKQKRSSTYIEFNNNDIITITPAEQYLSDFKMCKKKGKNIWKRDCIKYDNGKYKKGSIQSSINPFTEENKLKILNELKNKYDSDNSIIKGSFNISVKDLCNLSKKELELFRYVPKQTVYNSVLPPIDPYYVGYWLGDGHTANSGNITIGDEDQNIIVPYLEGLCKLYDLTMNKHIGEKGLGFALSKGNNGLGRNFNQLQFTNEWITNMIKACEELKLSKENETPHTRFRNVYDPVKKYLTNENYYCNCKCVVNKKIIMAKKDNTDEWIHFDNIQIAAENTDCGMSSIYNSSKDSRSINGWKFKIEEKKIENLCNYNTETIKGRKQCSILKSKQYSFITHLILHNISILSSKEAWNKLTQKEKDKYKIVDNKRDICKKYDNIDWVTLWEYYKIYDKDGEKGINKYIEEQKDKCSKIGYWFHMLNLTNNKHIPDIYKYSSIEVRKQLMAGLIDSDGTAGGFRDNNVGFEITQKKKELIYDIKEVAESLGWFCYLTEKYNSAVTTLEDGTKKRSEKGLYYRLAMTPYNNYDIPIKLERKKIKSMIINECIINGNIRRERKIPYPSIYTKIKSNII